MSKLLQFVGYSDDTFGEYHSTSDDYDNCASGEPIEWLVDAGEDGQLVVFGQYCPEHCGGWMIGVSPYGDDDAPIPEWRIWFKPCVRTPYSPELWIEAPDNAKVICLTREEEGSEDGPA